MTRHLQDAWVSDDTVSWEEVIAVRNRLTGMDTLASLAAAGSDVDGVIDRKKVDAYTAALAAQGLRRGDLGPAFPGGTRPQ